MTTKTVTHTPGPWLVHRLGSYTHIDAVGNHPLADVYGGMSEPTVCEANARLIAAAPQLLEALEAVKTSLGYFYDSTEEANDELMRKHGKALELAETAIRSAKGDTL